MRRLAAKECRKFTDAVVEKAPAARLSIAVIGPAGASQQDEEMGLCARAKAGWAHQPQTDTTNAAVKAHVNERYAQGRITDRKL